ncbi:gp53-like domain-containing protein [Jiulongibacter sediminis]|nr:hypothetical protein [Jiulongibacter sediminis]
MKTILSLILTLSLSLFGVGSTIAQYGQDFMKLESSTQGVRIPRLTTEARDTIPNPVAGLMILNTDDYCLDMYDGTQWTKNCGFEEASPTVLKAVKPHLPNAKISESGWTVDEQHIYSNKGLKVGINTATPEADLTVNGTLRAVSWYQQNTSPTGFARMGSIIIQWGRTTYENNNIKKVNFPISFSKLLSLTATVVETVNNTLASNKPAKIVKSTYADFEIGGTEVFSTGSNYPEVHWMAIGY